MVEEKKDLDAVRLCRPGNSGAQACRMYASRPRDRVIPVGTSKRAGQERRYKTTTNLELTREEFKQWSKEQGREVDPVSGSRRWDMDQYRRRESLGDGTMMGDG